VVLIRAVAEGHQTARSFHFVIHGGMHRSRASTVPAPTCILLCDRNDVLLSGACGARGQAGAIRLCLLRPGPAVTVDAGNCLLADGSMPPRVANPSSRQVNLGKPGPMWSWALGGPLRRFLRIEPGARWAESSRRQKPSRARVGFGTQKKRAQRRRFRAGRHSFPIRRCGGSLRAGPKKNRCLLVLSATLG